MKKSFLALLILSLLMVGPVFAQDPTLVPPEEMDADQMETDFVAALNDRLIAEWEIAPVVRNEILDGIAQEIADQVGCSDDPVQFNIPEEAADRGFATYPNDNAARVTRTLLLPAVNKVLIEEVVKSYGADIYGSAIAPQGHQYREIGVGVSPCVAKVGVAVGSTSQYGLFVILGAQPNVIPVVIGNGAPTIEAANAPVDVAIAVHEELSRPRSGIYGSTQDVRLSNEPLEDSDEVIPYARFIDYQLEECGENTVFYELTDTAGMKLSGEVSVTVECES